MAKKQKTRSYPYKVKSSKDPNLWRISSTQVISTHSPTACAGHYCCIHNPSNHRMRSWTMYWRDDKGVMERLCPAHGVGHPDPDDAAFNIRMGRSYQNIHGCCGCCTSQEETLRSAFFKPLHSDLGDKGQHC